MKTGITGCFKMLAGIAVFTALFCVGCVDKDKDDDTYTITFNANGGTVTPERMTTGTDGRLKSLPTPEREGYNFDGWYGVFSSGGDNPERLVVIDREFQRDLTIVAHWTPIIYVINYSFDGGEVARNVLVLSYNIGSNTFTLPYASHSISKDGYTFVGWTGTNGETPQTVVTIPKGSTGDREYFAHWEPEP